jgi:DNA-directed RNA polymerase specialized sigma24 family protein
MARTPHDPVTARVVDPELEGSLRRFLQSKGIPEGEVDEILGVARVQLLERGLPASPVEVDRLLFRIAQRRAIDWLRQTQVVLLGDRSVRVALRMRGGLPEPPQVPPEVEAGLQRLERLAAENPRHAAAFAAMKKKLAGKSLEESAAEAGVPPGTLRQWMNRFRAHARKCLPAPP